jgi:hypothetical protein
MRVPSRSSLFLALSVLAAACGGAASTDPPAASPSATPATSATAAPSEAAPATIPPLETAPPSAPASPEPSDVASVAPGSAAPGSADACTGTDANRDFFESVAAAVAWPVYCPVLPGGWFVDAGEYRLASGGRMEITYRGPDGARFALRQGAFCTTDGGCLPAGTDLGEAPFGDLTGTLVSADDGAWAIGVDVGADISWLASGTGIDEATFRRFAGDLAVVSG